MLQTRKDDCNRNIRDLGVLPEEAFDKYTKEKADKVRSCPSLYVRLDLRILIPCYPCHSSLKNFIM